MKVRLYNPSRVLVCEQDVDPDVGCIVMHDPRLAPEARTFVYTTMRFDDSGLPAFYEVRHVYVPYVEGP